MTTKNPNLNNPEFFRAYSIAWVIVGLISLGAGVVAGASIFGGVGITVPAAVMCIGGSATLIVSLYVAGKTPKYRKSKTVSEKA